MWAHCCQASLLREPLVLAAPLRLTPLLLAMAGFVLAYMYHKLNAPAGGSSLLKAIAAMWKAYATRASAEGFSDLELRRAEEVWLWLPPTRAGWRWVQLLD